MRGCFLAFFLWLTASGAGAQPIFSRPLSPRIASYRIQVQLDPATKRLDGRQTLTWRNTSGDLVRELRFHLYLNAFRNLNSTFMRESGGQLRGDYIDKNDKDAFGWIDLRSVQIRSGSAGRPGENLKARIQFIQPDDGNPADRTVIRIPLSEPIRPGETVHVDMDFRARLPEIFARTGFSRDFYLVGQWFPKIGVYEPGKNGSAGQWNCHQFHAHSEFYADFGNYDVSVTTPRDYRVGATGLLRSEVQNKNGTKTQRWQAEDVVDFAWTASPRYQEVNDVWRRPSGGTVRIRLLMQPDHLAQAERHLQAAKTALTYMDKHVGRYPYPNLTIVDPPAHALGAAGMEYSTFITAGTVWGMPAGLRLVEQVVIHEFVHQYFMQMLASNEFEEAWLDEGFTQYFQGRIMDETYGPNSSIVDLLGYRMGDLESSRSAYVHVDNPAIGPVYGNSWQLAEEHYGMLTYQKTATWLRTLEGLLGRPLMDEALRTYFSRWQFRHPRGQNFIDVVNELVPRRTGFRYGPDMNFFFEQVLYGDQVCDYELYEVRNRKQGSEYRSTITVYRRGDARMPVEVLVRFSDGKELMLHWDGKSRTRTFTLQQSAQVVWARVDPKQKIYMDINFNNNSYALSPSSAPAAKYAAKLTFWVQNWMQWLALLV